MKNQDIAVPIKPIDLLLIEDHRAFAHSLSQELSQQPQVGQVYLANTLQQACEIFDAHPIGLCVVDLTLPDGEGRTFIQAHHEQSTCVALTVNESESAVIASLAAGAAGYLLKDGHNLADRILAAITGHFPISAKVAGYLVSQWRQQQDVRLKPRVPVATRAAGASVAPPDKLSSRELEILTVLAQGHTYAETAKRLLISPHTVADHIKKIYRKLAVNSRSGAVYQASQLGVLKLTD